MDDVYRSQFRLPYPLYEKLKEASERAGRSLNAEVVYRLTQSFIAGSAPSNSPEAPMPSMVEHLVDKLTQPSHRAELETLVATICRLADQEKTDKK